MSNLIVRGGKKLSGTVTPSGNKNSILPILAATLLTNDPVILKNVPDLTDVNKLVETMQKLGSKVNWDKSNQSIKIQNDDISLDNFDGNFPTGMRGAILLLAPLLVRLEKLVWKSDVGGCSLGIREIDPHLEVLKALGVSILKPNGGLELSISDRFEAGAHWLDYMSVTTTETFLMAAVMADGKSEESILNNAASEPHVQELTQFLIQMGAQIEGVGTSQLKVTGVNSLHGTTYEVESDFHEITTFLALGAMTGGRVSVEKSVPQHFPLINRSFGKLGVQISYKGDTAYVEKRQEMKVQQPFTQNLIPKIEAAPWPYFPVDLLPLMMALATRTDGQVMFWNKVYEGANFWVQELNKFGVKFNICDPHRVIIWGGLPLKPAVVNSPEIIRATVALFMIAQTISGESVINNADPIKRAHPDFVEKMVKLGADVEWVD